MQKKIIYFLCTGNSCRSQMAEGFGKACLDGAWEVRSAGIEAHGINPKAIEAMKEIGIDISGQSSDIIQQKTLEEASLVITLCDDAYENCPIIPAKVKHLHWGFEDPAGKDWATFQSVRDAIGYKIKSYFNT